ncbi:MAG: GGDEF domain-containing protein [Bacilli bacterium]|nr:GGDEF domain-containing protein [Bacilli bacterium]
MKKRITMKGVYIAAALIASLMLILQFGIVTFGNIREAKSTTNAYLTQTEAIIAENRKEEETLMASLKQDCIVLAKAVAYYLDNDPSTINDSAELQKIASLMSIDEIHVFDGGGTIIGSTVQTDIGYTLYSGEQISYFLPMLSDRTLSMCQDVAPKTSTGEMMMFAMTWNEAGTQMVQVGITPTRLLEAFEKNSIQAVVEDIALDENMAIIVADSTTLEIVGAKTKSYLGQQFSSVTGLKRDSLKDGFILYVNLKNRSGGYFCSGKFVDEYCICIFLSYASFTTRTVLPLVIFAAYLLIASTIIVLVFRSLLVTKGENVQHLSVFQSMSEIYYSVHLLDLEHNTAIEYSSRAQVKEAFNRKQTREADKLMIGIMHATMSDEWLERGLEFTDLTTLAERMKDKKIISMELLGKNVGWIRMSFVTHEEENGIPKKVIISTQIIDEEKKAAEALYMKSHVDELTGCYNRRAYNNDIVDYENRVEEKGLVFVSFDVNGLKTVNDNIGHEAGDELIIGAANLMKGAFGKHGKIYRTGGDEFIGLIFADDDYFKSLCASFDRQIEEFHGKLISELSVSYGYVLPKEAGNKSMAEISDMADKRMYESKAAYYKRKGIDRRRT